MLSTVLSFGWVVEGFEPAVQTVVTKPSDPNVPDLSSAVYMDASVIPALNEFTTCVWYKPAPLAEQVILLLSKHKKLIHLD